MDAIDRLFGDIHLHFLSWDVTMSISLSYKLWRLSSTRNPLIVQHTYWSLLYNLATFYIMNTHIFSILYNITSIHFVKSVFQMTSEKCFIRSWYCSNFVNWLAWVFILQLIMIHTIWEKCLVILYWIQKNTLDDHFVVRCIEWT